MDTIYTPSAERYNGDMKFRRAGRSGILLPNISLGLWHNFGGIDSFSNSQKILHHALDKGITHFDLANNYGTPYGSAEETFGRVIQKSFAPYRHELFVSTKAGHDMWPGPYGDWGSRKYLTTSLDQSLKRMNLDYVDIFYTHRYDANTPLEETMQALVDIVKQGKALYVGISKYPTDVAEKAYKYLRERDTPCLLYQGKYNMLNREPEKDGILQQAKDNGAGYIAFSPLAQGLLSDKYLDGKVSESSRMAQNKFLKVDMLTSELTEKLNKLAAIAEQRGQTLSEMALTWTLREESVTSVIVGVRSTEQLDSNIKAVQNTTFTQEELNSINNSIGV